MDAVRSESERLDKQERIKQLYKEIHHRNRHLLRTLKSVKIEGFDVEVLRADKYLVEQTEEENKKYFLEYQSITGNPPIQGLKNLVFLTFCGEEKYILTIYKQPATKSFLATGKEIKVMIEEKIENGDWRFYKAQEDGEYLSKEDFIKQKNFFEDEKTYRLRTSTGKTIKASIKNGECQIINDRFTVPKSSGIIIEGGSELEVFINAPRKKRSDAGLWDSRDFELIISPNVIYSVWKAEAL